MPMEGVRSLTDLRQAAVVRGAALRGLQELAPRVKQARYHYGYDVCKEFREGVDPENLSYIEPFTGKKWCGSRMTWEVSKVCFNDMRRAS